MRRLLLLPFALALSACGGRVVVDSAEPDAGQPDAGQPVDACVAACAEQHADGAYMFLIGFSCICDGCSEACTERVCGESTLPSSACVACVQAGYLGDWCQNHEGLFSFCTHEPTSDCHAFANCMLAC
jgi:hypothetical protein